MLKDKFIQEEISKLKNKDKPTVKGKAVPPNLIDRPISQRNLKDEKIIKLASGIALDEAIEAEQFMHEIYVKEIEAGNISKDTSYNEWIMNLKTSLAGGGRVRLAEGSKKGESSFEQLADDWLDDIRVIYVDGKKEEFSEYIKRMGGVYDID